MSSGRRQLRIRIALFLFFSSSISRMLPLSRCLLSSVSNSSGRRALPHLLLLHRAPVLRVGVAAAGMSQENGGGVDRLDGATSTTSTSTNTNDADIRSSKKALRSSIVAALRALPDEELAAQSAEITKLVLSSPLWQSSRKVGVYLAAPRLREVDTEALVSAALLSEEDIEGGGAAAASANREKSNNNKKRLYVPIVGKGPQEMCLVHLDSLDGLKVVPPFGIREPSKTYGDGESPREDALSADIDTLFLPGVAFDAQGRRLGRGLGYYDAWAHRARRASEEAAAAAAAKGDVGDNAAAADGESESGKGPLLVGLAFSQQMLPETIGGGVPVEEHDVGLDAVVVAGEGVVATSERGRRRLLSKE